jgi:stage V sporulation protein S
MDPKQLNYYPNEPAIEAAYPAEPPVQTHPQPLNQLHPERVPGEIEILKVSATSRPGLVAGAIAGVVRQFGRVEIQAIGAGATNQAIKSIAIARGYLITSGIDIFCIPAFIDVIIDNEERTAIKFIVDHRTGFHP